MDTLSGITKSDLDALRLLHDRGLVVVDDAEGQAIREIGNGVSYKVAQEIMLARINETKEQLKVILNECWSEWRVGDVVGAFCSLKWSFKLKKEPRHTWYNDAVIVSIVGPNQYKVRYDDGDMEGVLETDPDRFQHRVSDPVVGKNVRKNGGVNRSAEPRETSFGAVVLNLDQNIERVLRSCNAQSSAGGRDARAAGAAGAAGLHDNGTAGALLPTPGDTQDGALHTTPRDAVVPMTATTAQAGGDGRYRERQAAPPSHDLWDRSTHGEREWSTGARVVGAMVKHWNGNDIGDITVVQEGVSVEVKWRRTGNVEVVSDAKPTGRQKKSKFMSAYREVFLKVKV